MWLAEAVNVAIAPSRPVIVDAARTQAQVAALRSTRPLSRVVYLSAEVATREVRYASRCRVGDAEIPFQALAATPLERSVGSLAASADFSLDSTVLSAERLAARVLSWLQGAD
jgi:hypothetical protein